MTFADVNISFSAKVNGTYAVAGFAWAAESGARVENVTPTGLLTHDFASAPTSTVTAWIAENGMKPEDANGCDYSGLVLRMPLPADAREKLYPCGGNRRRAGDPRYPYAYPNRKGVTP